MFEDQACNKMDQDRLERRNFLLNLLLIIDAIVLLIIYILIASGYPFSDILADILINYLYFFLHLVLIVLLVRLIIVYVINQANELSSSLLDEKDDGLEDNFKIDPNMKPS